MTAVMNNSFSDDLHNYNNVVSLYKQNDWEIIFGDLDTRQIADVRNAITNISVSYSMSMCTQINITLVDPNFEMLAANYFSIGRDILYRTKQLGRISRSEELTPPLQGDMYEQKMEIGRVTVGPGQGSSPSITIEARTKAVQQMKRDKDTNSIKGTGREFIIAAALKYGLWPVVEQIAKGSSKSKTSSGGDAGQDSVWDVLNRMASDSKAVLFEADGALYFGTMKWFLGKWGTVQDNVAIWDPETNIVTNQLVNAIPIIFPTPELSSLTGDRQRLADFRLLQMPSISKSDNDPYVSEASISLERTSAVVLRPGMTIVLYGMPTLSDIFLISEVNYEHLSPSPVSVTLRKPEREAKNIKQYAVGGTYVAVEIPTSVNFGR